jgi:chaperone modulatory protein CbpM
MTTSRNETLSGALLEEESDVTLAQLCEACAVHARSWRFTRSTVVRVRTVLRMQRDLRVNLAGAALALELLERIEALNARLRSIDAEGRR